MNSLFLKPILNHEQSPFKLILNHETQIFYILIYRYINMLLFNFNKLADFRQCVIKKYFH